MPRRTHKLEEVAAKLCHVGVITGQGRTLADSVKVIGVAELTLHRYRWRKEYRGLMLGQLKRLNPDVYEYLEAEPIKYAIRLSANRVLQERISYLLKRPVGRPLHEVCRYHASFEYQAQTWKKPRRVVAKI